MERQRVFLSKKSSAALPKFDSGKMLGTLKIFLMLFLLANTLFLAKGYEIEEFLLCEDVDEDEGTPISPVSVFYTENFTAYCWAKITEVKQGVKLRFDWHDPEGYIVESSLTIVEPPEQGNTWDWFTAWSNIYIRDWIPGETPGDWSVSIYVDDVLERTLAFEIIEIEGEEIDLETLINSLNILRMTIATLTENYKVLQDEYVILRDQYESLEEDFDEIFTDYQNLEGNYSKLALEFTQLQREYVSSEKILVNTRYMLYIASTIAAVSIVAALALSRRKPKK
jgi:hypothetical protein